MIPDSLRFEVSSNVYELPYLSNTFQGIRRRGLTIEALQQYMLAQGPSQAVVSLEWDSIWTTNKKVIDPIAPRFWAVLTANM